jgi:hypothetical protein
LEKNLDIGSNLGLLIHRVYDIKLEMSR